MKSIWLLVTALFALSTQELCKALYIENEEIRAHCIDSTTKTAHELLNGLNGLSNTLLYQLYRQKTSAERMQFLQELSKSQRLTLVNQTDAHGNSALHYAAKYGDTPTAQFLLENGASTMCRNNTGLTPLHYACGGRHISNGERHDAIKHIISLIPNASRYSQPFRTFFEKNVPFSGYTIGCTCNNPGAIQSFNTLVATLASYFLDKNSRNHLKHHANSRAIEKMRLDPKMAQTILRMLAKLPAKQPDTSLLELLLKHSRNMPLDLIDAQGRTPLMLAAMEQKEAFMEKLLSAGASSAIKDEYSNTADDYLRFYQNNPTTSPTAQIEAAYQCAAQWIQEPRDPDFIDRLANKIVTLFKKYIEGENILFLLDSLPTRESTSQPSLQPETINAFGESSFFSLLLKKDWCGASDLLESLGKEKIVELLEKKNCLGLTPLHLFAGDREIINGLMIYAIGLLFCYTDKNAVRQLYAWLGILIKQPLWAFSLPTTTKDNPDMVPYIEQFLAQMIIRDLNNVDPRLLLSVDHVKNSLTKIGRLVTYVTTSFFGRALDTDRTNDQSFTHLIETVLEETPLRTINTQDITGKTALMYAAITDNGHLVMQLLNHGADLNTTDNFGMSALDWAKMCRHRSIAYILEAAIATEEAIRSNPYCNIRALNNLVREHTGFNPPDNAEYTSETEPDDASAHTTSDDDKSALKQHGSSQQHLPYAEECCHS